MKYQLKVGEEIIPIEALPLDRPGKTQMVVLEKNEEVSFQAIAANHLYFRFDGTAVNAYLVDGPEGKLISINGRIFEVTEETQKIEANGRRGKLEDAPGEVTPPMPSVVVRILVKEGDWVSQGQGLIVVSAMKMETTLKAPKEGRVFKIHTALQAKVMPGDRLIEIKEGTRDE